MNGLALSVLEHIPAVGETFQLGRLTFTVLEMEEQKIEKCVSSLPRILKRKPKRKKRRIDATPLVRKGTCYEYRENECP